MRSYGFNHVFAKRLSRLTGWTAAAASLIALAGCARYVAETYHDPKTGPHPQKSTKDTPGSMTAQAAPAPVKTIVKTKTVVKTVKVPVPIDVSPELLRKAGAPECEVKGAEKPANAEEPGSSADPNLVEIARIELERDCFKKAEAGVRVQLEKLQDEVSAKN